MKLLKKLLSLAVVAALAVGGYVLLANKNNDKTIGETFERSSYDVIGTASSNATITSVYTGNTKTLLSGGLENLHLDIKYTPASQDSVLFVLVEGSNDGGTTYFPLGNKAIGTTDIKLYAEGVTSTIGMPIVFPGDSTSASGTALFAGVDFDMVADHVKISAKESTTSTKGTAYIRTTLTTKK